MLRHLKCDLVRTIYANVRAILLARGRDAPPVALHSKATGAASKRIYRMCRQTSYLGVPATALQQQDTGHACYIQGRKLAKSHRNRRFEDAASGARW